MLKLIAKNKEDREVTFGPFYSILAEDNGIFGDGQVILVPALSNWYLPDFTYPDIVSRNGFSALRIEETSE